MYSEETLRKFVTEMRAEIERYKAEIAAGNLPEICITDGNEKIGHAWNVSKAPIITCGNCAQCSGHCYDIKAGLQYPDTLKARARNTAIFEAAREAYFDAILKLCSDRRKHKYFRFHVGGEIVDLDEFERMVDVARQRPAWTFWTYTKMHGIVNEYCRKYGRESIPENFKVMFSEWRGTEIDNPYGFPVFHTVFISQGEQFEPDMWICPGNCDICKAEKRGCIVGESTQNADH